MRSFVALVCGVVIFFSCKKSTPPSPELSSPVQFTALAADQTGIAFRNDVPYSDSFNCYLFRNFYNGGGVGLGDVNNDGLLDVFLCGNLSPNRLYLNLGNWQFRDITEACGMGLSNTWTAGVAIADVNGDGWLDVYTCKSGPPGGPDRHNELFINTLRQPGGVPIFEEQSKKYGLDNAGLSTHAAFFDYDRDGDLDCYLLNNSLRSVGGYDYRPDQRNTPDPEGGNALLRNDGQRFTNVSAQAGIYSSAIGFGLGVTVGDYDRDGWQDLFVSNDFFERDYLYHNQHDGTFQEVLVEKMPEISKGSMGADMADLNNDGFPEIFVTEMTPPDERRYKTKATFDDWNSYQLMYQTGYHRQFGRNVLQINNLGNSFSEIGRLADVAYTDWSWGALIADFDNDGLKDIFVANGIGKDLLDQDYVNFYSNPAAIREILQKNPGQGIKTLIDQMPSQPVANYFFHQKKPDAAWGGLPQFDNLAAAAGLGTPSFSNGSAYGDLDNDGDLDLLVNNVNMPCFVYRNETNGRANWLKINVVGEGRNPFAYGAKVEVTSGGITQYQEVAPMRGFESCVDPRPNFGLPTARAERVLVTFLSGKEMLLTDVAANQILTIEEKNATQSGTYPNGPRPEALAIFSKQKIPNDAPLPKAVYADFDREPLLFRMNSGDAPCVATGDVNADGLADVYVGGVANVAGQLLLQTPAGDFQKIQNIDFQKDRASEDAAAAFFDANGDGHLDLYVGSGSSEFEAGSVPLQDRLYLGDGRGHFVRMPDALPLGKPFATACVAPDDVDGDGDVDVFVGMRLIPGRYGQAPSSNILLNDGRGHFSVAPPSQYPALKELGMLTDAAWADVDGDGSTDLVTTGEWEAVRIFLKKNKQLVETPCADAATGWWNCLTIKDLDQDGDLDFVVGNHGRNARFRASRTEPMSLWIGDFDQNGTDEPLLCQYASGTSYPLVLRPDLVRQMPFLKKKYLYFRDYAGQTMAQIFTPEQLKLGRVKETVTLETSVFWNQGQGVFVREALPLWAQISPVHAVAVADWTGDGLLDLLLAGNDERCKPETGQYLASRGVLLAREGATYRRVATNLDLDVVRDLAVVPTRRGPRVLATRPDAAPLWVDWARSK
jgi:enediyne biosynthesis protein E4